MAPKLHFFGQKSLKKLITLTQKKLSLRKLGPPTHDWEVFLTFVSQAKIKKLNAHFRGKQQATDVLSFRAAEPFFNAGVLGELVISKSVLKLQAKAFGNSVEEELSVLLVHGFLHLLGFDHERGLPDARLMSSWEKRLLLALGLSLRQGLIARPQVIKEQALTQDEKLIP